MNNTILVLCPHPDDAEFACGGAISKFLEQGKDIYYIVFSPCNLSLPKEFETNTLYNELDKASGTLGIKSGNITKFDFPVRNFPSHRQEILEILVKINQEINPGLVLLPNSEDIHQDHHTIYMEGFRAFKNKSMLGYELPWNNTRMVCNYYITLEEKHLNNKIHAIAQYQSQQFRSYMKPEIFHSLASLRGVQCNAPYAEAYELIKWVD